jgi:hypothetical protein
VENQPDILGTVEGALRDAWPLMRSRKVYLTLAVLCAVLVGVMIAITSAADATQQQQLRVATLDVPLSICIGIAAFFVMPAVARTARPEFKLTFGRVLALLAITLIVGIASEIGLALLLLPGIWLGVKLSQTTWTYLLSDGKNPFGESWQLTTGHFWETFCFFFLLGILMAIVEIITLLIPIVISALFPISGIVLGPFVFLAYVYVYHIFCLANMRWMLELRQLPPPAEAVPAAATA